MPISCIKDVLEDYKQGKMVILMDDEDRENEGDIMMAAECISAQDINFMATHGRGLICLTLTQQRCQELNLFPMVQNPTEPWATAFTVSIEAAQGVTTGISAEDRAVTVQAAVAKGAQPQDLVQPGHIFPLAAKDGGVLVRAGHTEAGCDLARLAGHEPASVIVEILNDDGTMARRPQLEMFAEKHGIKLGTIADLIEYRNATETTIERVASCQIPTEFGEFSMVTYKDTVDNQIHHAMVKGSIDEQPTNVRVHVKDTFQDVLFSTRESQSSWTLNKAMATIADRGGILVILEGQDSSESQIAKVKRYQALDQGENYPQNKKTSTSRKVGVGSQILADLGVSKMNLLSSADKKYHSLSGFGLEVVDYVEPS
ncbi:3,4-dihydroxy-2-butanone-4-phosphate synthase [Vibrio barjaei]|jgi:3,4-dihydroxy 2-butanone 4-phosphate synthase/GTP cyclohydrolase II|uniref:3,4-dihydroxy-2-butanone 4-phosphate synthase n=1 Tax=Vibrio barjaei TaxID=1676683 RepID=A0ABW7IJ63_9VIBR|nr:3,4-dihydroxy-2-butanone-4-phosphate synthase [Vibrio barjaei]MCY9870618.1 3,4-dihydroxy-2-butanone-4-phosphate synthase [Vibrio barjaei]OIN25151.1 3,4-dihydroxy-2-butanone-4-phosphate synthase [Vibrio barjaei]